MTKRNKIIYWIATIWLALGMTSTGIVQLLNIKEETEFILRLGYPEYFLTILGVSKLLGVAVLLVPRFPLLKEWAYAGFVFTMLGALYSHSLNESAAAEIFGSALLLTLTALSWYFRPAERRIIPVTQ